VACLVPPKENRTENMTLADSSVREGDVINLGRTVAYRCAPNHYFEQDRDQESFEIECAEDNQFIEPNPFPECIKGKTANAK
jgi:hypothetical protein